MPKNFEALEEQSLPTATILPSTEALWEAQAEYKYHLLVLSRLIWPTRRG